jgi:hypothetical protein
VGLVVIAFAIAQISKNDSSHSTTRSAKPGVSGATSHTHRISKDAQGYSCLKSRRDFALRCPANPNFGKTKLQVHAEAIARAKAAQRAKIAARRAAAAARASEKRAAAARAAAAKRVAAARAARIAAANAWHKGYFDQDDNVYWRWVNGRSCQDFAEHGCWHVEVITRDGCASYVAVNANEYSGGTIIDSLLDNQGYGIPPKTPRVFELDADQDAVTASNVTVDCN